MVITDITIAIIIMAAITTMAGRRMVLLLAYLPVSIMDMAAAGFNKAAITLGVSRSAFVNNYWARYRQNSGIR